MRLLHPVLATMWVASLATAQDELPPIRLAAGHVASFDLGTNTRIGMGPVGGNTDLVLHTRLEVLAVDGEDTRLRITWIHVSGEVVVPMLTARFDTRKPVASDLPGTDDKIAKRLARGIAADLSKPYEALAGFSYEVVVDRCGRIRSMPGLEKAVDALRAKVRKGPNPDTVDTLCDERTLRWQVGLMLPVRPETAAKPGAKWKHARTLGLGNSTLAVVDVNVGHVLERLSPDRATIGLRGVPSIAPGHTKMVEPSLEGSFVVDLASGLAESGWVALDAKLRPEGAAKLLAQDVECDWVVKRIRE